MLPKNRPGGRQSAASARRSAVATAGRLPTNYTTAWGTTDNSPLTTGSSPFASVCIPTYNGGELLYKVVQKILAQRTPWPFEIIIVDTSSTDGSIQRVADLDRVTVFTIQKNEFGHGKTRNLAASLGNGEFIVFLTQDAMPADEFWLYNMVTTVAHFPMAAGGFGRHEAWSDASAFVKRDIQDHFKGFNAFPICLSSRSDQKKWESGDVGWRQVLHFFSDNNSCLRRSVWKQIQYPDIEFGEDQAWASLIIEAGYEKIYAPDALVYHSHDYEYDETKQRSYEEAKFFKEYFGYEAFREPPSLEIQVRNANSHDEKWAADNGVDYNQLQKRFQLNQAKLLGLQRAMTE